MGIYIKGVEIPKSCAGCALYRFGYTMESECWSMCAVSGKDIDNPFNIGRSDWCPLIPVPPHGRCVDADALMSEVDDGDDVMFVWAITDAPTIIKADPEEEETK